MELNIKEKVEDELVVTMIREILELKAGSKERSVAVDDLSKLLHSLNEDERNNNEYAVKKDQLIEQTKDRAREERKSKWSNWLTIGGLGLGLTDLVKDVICFLWGLNFEEGGTITSPHVRQNLNKLFRKHEVPKKIY